jgi:hypothetical protein
MVSQNEVILHMHSTRTRLNVYIVLDLSKKNIGAYIVPCNVMLLFNCLTGDAHGNI